MCDIFNTYIVTFNMISHRSHIVIVELCTYDEAQRSINMIRRGCEDALAGNRACLTAEDFLVRPTIVPFDVSSTEVNGRACFCDGNRCNENINQNNIGN